MPATHVDLYTDGACIPNPGRGAYAAVLRCEGQQRDLTGAYVHTTNNRMELMGVLIGLTTLTWPCHVAAYTDSKYVVTMIEKLTSPLELAFGLTAYANRDLLLALAPLLQTHHVQAVWVKGHNGHYWNEYCDVLAGQTLQAGPWAMDEGMRG